MVCCIANSVFVLYKSIKPFGGSLIGGGDFCSYSSIVYPLQFVGILLSCLPSVVRYREIDHICVESSERIDPISIESSERNIMSCYTI